METLRSSRGPLRGSWRGRPEAGSNFGLGFLFLSGDKREALSAVYAFCRHVDDVVDRPGPKPQAEAELAFWEGEIGRLYEDRPTHPIARRLLPAVRRFRLPREAFLHILEGVGMDLRIVRYETFGDLEPYLFRVAGAVGLLSIEIFGYAPSSASSVREYARRLGCAFQMTNILRDIGTDLEAGRVYIPQEDLRRFGCSLNGKGPAPDSPGFTDMMRFECERAKGFYREAREALPPAERKNMLAAEVMAAIYERLLHKIEASDFDVLERKIALNPLEKLACAFKAWRCV